MCSDESCVNSSLSSISHIVGSTPSATKLTLRELKKELKGIDKLTKKNLDIKSWKSELKLWIRYQNITDPEIIYIACILTSSGEVREIIQDLKDRNSFINDDEEEEDDNEEENSYPSLDKIVDAIEIFYGLKEDQNVLLRDLRALRIKKNERVKDFNIRYRSLYLKLDSKRKKQVSVLDYADSLQNNPEAWKKVALKDNISLNKAFTIAEKVDRLTTRSIHNNYENSSYKYNSNFNSNTPNKFNKNYQGHNNFKGKYDSSGNRKVKEPEIDLTRKMKNLSIKVCFFCQENGHVQTECPELQRILENNRKEMMSHNHLN